MDPPRKRNKKHKNTGKTQQHPNGVKREAQPKAPKVKPDRISPPKKTSGPTPTSRSSRSRWIKTSVCLLLFSVVLGGSFCAWYMWDDGVGQLVEHWWTKYGFSSKDVLKDADHQAESEFEDTYNFQRNDELFHEGDENPKDVGNEEDEEDEISPNGVEISEDIINGLPANEVESKFEDQPIEVEYEAAQEELFKHIDKDHAIPETDEEHLEKARNILHDEFNPNHHEEAHGRFQRDAKKLSGSHMAEEKYSRETSSSSSQAVRKPDKGQVVDEPEEGSETKIENDSDSEAKERISAELASEESLNKETIAAQILEGIQKGSSKSSDGLENLKLEPNELITGKILEEIDKKSTLDLKESIAGQILEEIDKKSTLDLKESIAGQILEEIDKKSTLDLKESIAGQILEEIDKKNTINLKDSVAGQILDEIQKHEGSEESLIKSQKNNPNGSPKLEKPRESSPNSETDDELDTSDYSFNPKDDLAADDSENEIPIRRIQKDLKLKKYEEVKKAKEEKISKLDDKKQARNFHISEAKEEVTTNEPAKVKDNKLKSIVVEPKEVMDQDKVLDEFKPGKVELKPDTFTKEELKFDNLFNQNSAEEVEVAKKEQMTQKEKISEDGADIAEKNVKAEVRTNENKENKNGKDTDSLKKNVDNIQGKAVKEDKLERMKAYVHHSITNELDYEIRKELDSADKLLNSEKFDDALEKYGALASKHPQSPRAVYGKGLAYNGLAEQQKSNNFLELCIAELERVFELPDVPDAIIRKAGDLLVDRCRFRGFLSPARKYQKKLIARFPEDLDLQNQLAVTYLLLGQEEASKNILEKVLEVDPKNGFAKVHLGFLLKTHFKDIENGIRLMEEGIATKELGTDSGRFYYHLGDGLQRLNKTKEAYKVYEEGAKRGHFLSAYQRSLYNVDSLTGRPWWKPEQTGYQKFLKLLEDNWPIIRDEGLAQMNESSGIFLPESEDLSRSGEWKQFTLYSQGRKSLNSCMKAPKTCDIIDQIPDAAECKRGQVKFSIMQPGTHVWPHTGPTNCRLRVHLGLVVPPGSHIRVANETRTWQEGKLIIFDDSFEHEVWHEGTKFRLIFIVDFWHPELTVYEKQTLTPI